MERRNHDKKYRKGRDPCHYTGKYKHAAHSICITVPKAFQNGSNYDYHFIITELAERFKWEFSCLWENTKKYIHFSVPIKKKLRS